jgi:hypothetical protein
MQSIFTIEGGGSSTLAALASDGRSLFVAGLGGGWLARMRLPDRPFETLGTTSTARALAIDDTCLYYLDDDGISSMAKDAPM